MKKALIYQPPRGTRDFLPADVLQKRKIENSIRDSFELYGFQEISTPIFEYPTLWTVRSGEKILEEMFLVKWGGAKEDSAEEEGLSEWALRPELTAPVCRMFVSGSLSRWARPIKVFYVGQCFRYDKPAPGRYREFWQAGLELIGSRQPEADAEVIAVAHLALDNLGLKDNQIRIGHLGLLRGILEENEIGKDVQNILIGRIDKDVGNITKIKAGIPVKDENGEMMDEIGIYQSLDVSLYEMGIRGHLKEIIVKMIDLKGEKESTIKKAKEIFGESPKAMHALAEFEEILNHLQAFGIQDVIVDLSIARGLAFYTGMVFEIDINALDAQKQVCGGGRYDNLISEFGGQSAPATGFAFGLDRLIESIKSISKEPERPRVDVIVSGATDEVRSNVEGTAQEIRLHGIRAEIDLMRRGLKETLSIAEKINVPYVVIVGPRELKENKIILRNMKEKMQEAMPLNEAIKKVKESI